MNLKEAVLAGGPVERHDHDWVTIYELIDCITVKKCRVRECGAIATRTWEKVLYKTTVWPNGDAEIEPTWARRSASPSSDVRGGEMSEEPAGWRVVFGNYFPREVDGTYRTEEEAEARASALGDMWEVEPFFFDTTDPDSAK